MLFLSRNTKRLSGILNKPRKKVVVVIVLRNAVVCDCYYCISAERPLFGVTV